MCCWIHTKKVWRNGGGTVSLNKAMYIEMHLLDEKHASSSDKKQALIPVALYGIQLLHDSWTDLLEELISVLGYLENDTVERCGQALLEIRLGFLANCSNDFDHHFANWNIKIYLFLLLHLIYVFSIQFSTCLWMAIACERFTFHIPGFHDYRPWVLVSWFAVREPSLLFWALYERERVLRS